MGWGAGCPGFPPLISAADVPAAMPGPGNTELVQARSPASLPNGQTELAFSEVGRDPPLPPEQTDREEREDTPDFYHGCRKQWVQKTEEGKYLRK